MKLRLPLFAQILGWFFLNLALLVGAGWLVVRSNVTFGLDSLLLAQGEARVQGLADLVTAELRERPRAEWSAVLRRYSEAHGVELHFYEPNGLRLAGPDTPLPRVVHDKLTEVPSVGAPRPERPRPGEEPGAPPPRPVVRANPKYLLRTEQAPRYWLLTRTMIPGFGGNRMPSALIAASDSIGFNGLLFDFRPWLLSAGGAALLSALFWLPFVRAITRSVARMTQTTGEIAEGRFDVRVATRRHDELGSLAASINLMAGRLAGFVTGQKRFLGDVAHELCAPLARIQMSLGILEQRADEKQKADLEDLREEVQHMSGLVNELLSFSKAGLQQKDTELQPVELTPLAQRVVTREAGVNSPVRVEIPDGCLVLAEPELLARALANLVRNALRHAGDAGPITVSAVRDADRITLSVTDSGPGVPEEKLQQIFDPFFRLDESRTRETGGIGLGLAIVKTCVEACRGTVTARNREPQGLQVEMTFQAVDGSE